MKTIIVQNSAGLSKKHARFVVQNISKLSKKYHGLSTVNVHIIKEARLYFVETTLTIYGEEIQLYCEHPNAFKLYHIAKQQCIEVLSQMRNNTSAHRA